MIGFLGAAYAWVKAAHLIFVIFWMAGLFMLPRFFAYHQETDAGSPEIAKWVDRETRLIKIILNPAMIIVWILGLVLTVNIGAWAEGWFYMKFAAVLALSAYHGWMAGYARKLAQGQAAVSSKSMRLLNEVPGIATAIIVVLVIVKPF